MKPSTTLPTSREPAAAFEIKTPAGLGLVDLRGRSPLTAQLWPGGAVFAWRHEGTLINQLLPGPAEDGLFRLLVRWRERSRDPAGWGSLVGAGLPFLRTGPAGAAWHGSFPPGLRSETRLMVHPDLAAWMWQVHLHNTGTEPLQLDVFHAQDLGLADEAAVRNNEAYVSQYLDLLPVPDRRFGTAIFARQNQPAAGGRHPWLGVACVDGAAGWCTDGWQFFGADHRLTGEPAAVRMPLLPSRRLQYEFALAGLQSRAVVLPAGSSAVIAFIARFLEDHPAASGPADLALLEELLPFPEAPVAPAARRRPVSPPLFVSAGWMHGMAPTAEDWAQWFPGDRRVIEVASDGTVLSFFHGEHTHVVSRAKEARVARPHGHVLRSGDSLWIDGRQFGVTCYAAGVFGAQSYLGNPSLARLLSVVRNPLNVARAQGQRIFVRERGSWRQLGLPSAFAMAPDRVRWIYRLAGATLEARVWCSARLPASFLDLRVTAGPPCEFLVTHQLALGANELDDAGRVEIDERGWFLCRPAPDGLLARRLPATRFAIALADPKTGALLGGDELLHADGGRRDGPYAVVRVEATARCGMIMLGTSRDEPELAELVAAARSEYAENRPPAALPPLPLQLQRPGDPAVARVNEVLPWFHHNASIHFSAPHGLEQYGGAAWGVRDVCQGSLEWLLAIGQFAVVRRMLTTVFAQQYAADGTWPQWFMHPPFRFLQQAHSHGDVCFWPVKALCDYVAATNDLAFLAATVGYTDATEFTPVGPEETLWAHCDRVIAHVASRFAPGTALVNYGDGDWDDTLQPADPAMRTRMVSAWTVALAYQAFRQLADVSRRAGEEARASRLESLLARMRRDFHAQLMPDGVVAGFLVFETSGPRPLLHPRDAVTGIRYRLLPMTRAILAELFTPDEAAAHLALVGQHLRFVDGVRLMSEPSRYDGGCERLFKRADTAANVGREIGLQYVHAHLRYAEALARVGDADGLWHALQVVNPVGLHEVLPQAALRQSNVYFSSSDADFADRYEAAARWEELRAGQVTVRAGWRLYSSGPGLFLHKVRTSLLGLRESFGEVVFDPVLPRALDGLVVVTELCGRPVRITYRVRKSTHAPAAVIVNGTTVAGTPEPNPYRAGGRRLRASELAARLARADNHLEIEL